jgi:polyphenol oxidase
MWVMISAVVQKNRDALKALLPNEPVWLNQIHGTQVADVDEHGSGSGVPKR